VIPLAPDDPELKLLAEMGLTRVYGGTQESCLIALTRAGDPEALEPMVAQIFAANADGSAPTQNNKLPPITSLVKMLMPRALEAHQRELDAQRFHAGRMELACFVYAYALESTQPERAHRWCNAARGFGSTRAS
jgi:hypothetical protein